MPIAGCKMSEVVVSGVRRLSTISEKDVDPGDELQFSGESEWRGSLASLCSHGKPSVDSSTLASFESYQPDGAGTALYSYSVYFCCSISSCGC